MHDPQVWRNFCITEDAGCPPRDHDSDSDNDGWESLYYWVCWCWQAGMSESSLRYVMLTNLRNDETSLTSSAQTHAMITTKRCSSYVIGYVVSMLASISHHSKLDTSEWKCSKSRILLCGAYDPTVSGMRSNKTKIISKTVGYCCCFILLIQCSTP